MNSKTQSHRKTHTLQRCLVAEEVVYVLRPPPSLSRLIERWSENVKPLVKSVLQAQIGAPNKYQVQQKDQTTSAQLMHTKLQQLPEWIVSCYRSNPELRMMDGLQAVSVSSLALPSKAKKLYTEE